MADPDPRADGATPPGAEANAPEFSLQSVYLKDCSFEAPKGPRIEGPWNPQIGLDLNTASEAIAPDLREVVLTVSITAKLGEATAFLVEVKQAGLFGVGPGERRSPFSLLAPAIRLVSGVAMPRSKLRWSKPVVINAICPMRPFQKTCRWQEDSMKPSMERRKS